MLSGLKVQIGSLSCEKSGDKSACFLRLCGILSGSLVANCSSQLLNSVSLFAVEIIYVRDYLRVSCMMYAHVQIQRAIALEMYKRCDWLASVCIPYVFLKKSSRRQALHNEQAGGQKLVFKKGSPTVDFDERSYNTKKHLSSQALLLLLPVLSVYFRTPGTLCRQTKRGLYRGDVIY